MPVGRHPGAGPGLQQAIGDAGPLVVQPEGVPLDASSASVVVKGPPESRRGDTAEERLATYSPRMTPPPIGRATQLNAWSLRAPTRRPAERSAVIRDSFAIENDRFRRQTSLVSKDVGIVVGTPPAEVGAWLAGRSASSRRVYAAALEAAARAVGQDVKTIDWARLDPAALEYIREQLRDAGRSPSWVNLALSAVRSLVRHLWRQGLVPDERRARIDDVAGARGKRELPGRHVETHELAAIAKACAVDRSLVGLRDVAIIGLAATTGLRRAELVGLDVGDVNLDTGRGVVRGKGDKRRAIYVTNGALDALRDWAAARGPQPGALFVRLIRNVGGSHRVTGDRVSVQTIVDTLKRRAREGGIEAIRPHDLRRTVAGELLDAGTDIVTVARLLGHANVQTTARYDRRPEHVVAAAAAKMKFPYRKRADV